MINQKFENPEKIIYSSHPSVSALLQAKILEGRQHDHQNPASIYRSLPGWIAEEDEEKSKHLKYLTQIIASFFDDTYLQMQEQSIVSMMHEFAFENNYKFCKQLDIFQKKKNN